MPKNEACNFFYFINSLSVDFQQYILLTQTGYRPASASSSTCFKNILRSLDIIIQYGQTTM